MRRGITWSDANPSTNGAVDSRGTPACGETGEEATGTSSPAETHTCDAANQLTKYVDNTGTTTLTYDATGNQRTQQVATGGITTNTWDFENRLTKVALPTGVADTFTYNADGQRVKRQDSSGTLSEVWDGQKILLETDANNVTQVVYTLTPGLYGDLVSQRRAGVGRYFLFDPLGSTTRLTDGSQNVTDSYLFKAFGESLLAAPPTINPFGYVGRLGYCANPDIVQLYLRARFYDSHTGRFQSVDPLLSQILGRTIATGDGFRNTGTMNLFQYVANNPANVVDPSGYDWWSCVKNSLGGGAWFWYALAGCILGAAAATAAGSFVAGPASLTGGAAVFAGCVAGALGLEAAAVIAVMISCAQK